MFHHLYHIALGAVSQSIINIIFYYQNQLKYAVKTDPIFAGMKTEEPLLAEKQNIKF